MFKLITTMTMVDHAIEKKMENYYRGSVGSPSLNIAIVEATY
jgi:hypothetical protein